MLILVFVTVVNVHQVLHQIIHSLAHPTQPPVLLIRVHHPLQWLLPRKPDCSLLPRQSYYLCMLWLHVLLCRVNGRDLQFPYHTSLFSFFLPDSIILSKTHSLTPDLSTSLRITFFIHLFSHSLTFVGDHPKKKSLVSFQPTPNYQIRATPLFVFGFTYITEPFLSMCVSSLLSSLS